MISAFPNFFPDLIFCPNIMLSRTDCVGVEGQGEREREKKKWYYGTMRGEIKITARLGSEYNEIHCSSWGSIPVGMSERVA